MQIAHIILAEVAAALEADPGLAARLRTVLGLVAPDALLPVRAAAAELGVRPRVIVDAARRGEIAIAHARRRPVVARAELSRWLATRAVVSPPSTSADLEVAASLATAANRLRRSA